MKKNKKLLKIFIIFIFIIFIFTSSFADDIPLQEEDFDIASYLRTSDYLETSSPTQQFPSINSRAYVVLDRKTNTVLVGKNEYSRPGITGRHAIICKSRALLSGFKSIKSILFILYTLNIYTFKSSKSHPIRLH